MRTSHIMDHRSIPADAGEATSPSSIAHSREVDPRGCGGGNEDRIVWFSTSGRSPRMRGRRLFNQEHLATLGSIPADAGEAQNHQYYSNRRRVDPRGCGGGHEQDLTKCGHEGRSPRMRGRRGLVIFTIKPMRSIPADAGEASSTGKLMNPSQVDPRGCGGGLEQRRELAVSRGRSPRMRGRHRSRNLPNSVSRSIPADAGEAHGKGFACNPKGVDPRGCGGGSSIKQTTTNC